MDVEEASEIYVRMELTNHRSLNTSQGTRVFNRPCMYVVYDESALTLLIYGLMGDVMLLFGYYQSSHVVGVAKAVD